jgi:hypothetical protein
MPKDIFSKREDLVCGKLDKLFDLFELLIMEKINPYTLEMEAKILIYSIRGDVKRMEKKLISRKEEAGEIIESGESLVEHHENEHWEGFQVQDKD